MLVQKEMFFLHGRNLHRQRLAVSKNKGNLYLQQLQILSVSCAAPMLRGKNRMSPQSDQ